MKTTKISRKEQESLKALAIAAADVILSSGDNGEEVDPDIAHRPYTYASRAYPFPSTRDERRTCPRFRLFVETAAARIIDIGRDADLVYETDEPEWASSAGFAA